MPGRGVRPRRPPPPLPVRQLHQLRPAVHDRAGGALRPAADDDGRVRDVRALPGRVRRPARPPLPRPAERLPRLRAARVAGGRPTATRPSRARTSSRQPRASSPPAAILAVKGIGGFHLACLAADEDAVAALRSRKHREQKPFALMAPDARGGARAGRAGRAGSASCCSGRERPIVIGRRRDAGAALVRRSVAPTSADLGVMLPYSPLHHLLLADSAPRPATPRRAW